MSVTYQKPEPQAGGLSWRLKWSSDAALPVTFRVYSEGVLLTPDGLVSADGLGEWVLVVPPGEYPFFEVLDKACSIPSIAFSGHLLLQWYGSGNKEYKIEKLISAVWTAQETITDSGAGYFSWRSGWLADVTTHTYRIVPVSLAENDGTPLSLICFVARHPNSPQVAVTYNGAGLKNIHIAFA